MRDLCSIFEDMGNDPRNYREMSEDIDLPFHKVLEIVDQENEDNAYDE